jgi:pyrimidine-nucleoside phosphorylase
VRSLAAWPIGHATMLLGAGRTRVDSGVDPAVGLILEKKVGDPVGAGERLCTVHVNDESRLDTALGIIRDAFAIDDQPVEPEVLIVERL